MLAWIGLSRSRNSSTSFEATSPGQKAREEAREAGRLVAVKAIELIIVDLKANITALEGTL